MKKFVGRRIARLTIVAAAVFAVAAGIAYAMIPDSGGVYTAGMANSTGAGIIPGSSYQWQQPGAAPVRTPHAQPRLSSAQVRLAGLKYTSSSGYVWAQPGTAPVTVPDAQPW